MSLVVLCRTSCCVDMIRVFLLRKNGSYFAFSLVLCILKCCCNSNEGFDNEGIENARDSLELHKTYVFGESSLAPMTSKTIKQAHFSNPAASLIRNHTFLLFSDHAGMVKSTAQELLNAGVPRENIYCIGLIFYAHVLQPEHALDGDLCTIPAWNGEVRAFLGRPFPRRLATAFMETTMYWTILESPAVLREFADRFCPAIASFDFVWIDIPSGIFASLVAPCVPGGLYSGARRRPRLVVRMGHRFDHETPWGAAWERGLARDVVAGTRSSMLAKVTQLVDAALAQRPAAVRLTFPAKPLSLE